MFSKIQDRNLWYTDSGSGFVIVLLHGYLESSAVWDDFSRKLAQKFRVISIDLPGHGFSEVFGETHSMEMMASVIRDLLDSLKIKKAFLTGHSLGGYVSLAFLEFYPEYLSGYCLFHSHPFADTPEATEKRKREISIVKAGKKDLMYPENIEKMFASRNLDKFSDALSNSKKIAEAISGEGIIAMLNGMMVRPSRVGVVEEGRVPCLWILGSMDNYISPGVKEKVRLPSNSKVEILENSGHMGFIEEQDISLKLITSFVNSLT